MSCQRTRLVAGRREPVRVCLLCGRPNDLAGRLRPYCSFDCAEAAELLAPMSEHVA